MEIGPGTGVLTEALLNAKAKVIAVEKDFRSIQLLKDKFAENCHEFNAGQFKVNDMDGNLAILSEDILKLNKHSIGLEERGYAVVANIPYYITGMILQSFLEYSSRPDRMILLVQKEVADRIVARDGKESLLSISVKAFGTPSIIAKIPPGAFTPPPTVDSAVLAIRNISDRYFSEKDIDIQRFFEIVRAGFAHKRKVLIRNLETVMEPAKLKEIWTDLALNEKVRAENLRLEDWLEICIRS
ncbi:MAG: 16S rRNA (adenine(1518)-N(6)/adenine(1519)-N(6))-dimethyltransferase RsmA [Candidatus Taylorbacteria bacterium]|nr:16S rRNA (adenine(1518)-N(6)/adenine(1519)-N(6))-dimethyltransferase RsmA [Candidatus Taylorbacteria bacterium]